MNLLCEPEKAEKKCSLGLDFSLSVSPGVYGFLSKPSGNHFFCSGSESDYTTTLKASTSLRPACV